MKVLVIIVAAATLTACNPTKEKKSGKTIAGYVAAGINSNSFFGPEFTEVVQSSEPETTAVIETTSTLEDNYTWPTTSSFFDTTSGEEETTTSEEPTTTIAQEVEDKCKCPCGYDEFPFQAEITNYAPHDPNDETGGGSLDAHSTPINIFNPETGEISSNGSVLNDLPTVAAGCGWIEKIKITNKITKKTQIKRIPKRWDPEGFLNGYVNSCSEDGSPKKPGVADSNDIPKTIVCFDDIKNPKTEKPQNFKVTDRGGSKSLFYPRKDGVVHVDIAVNKEMQGSSDLDKLFNRDPAPGVRCVLNWEIYKRDCKPKIECPSPDSTEEETTTSSYPDTTIFSDWADLLTIFDTTTMPWPIETTSYEEISTTEVVPDTSIFDDGQIYSYEDYSTEYPDSNFVTSTFFDSTEYPLTTIAPDYCTEELSDLGFFQEQSKYCVECTEYETTTLYNDQTTSWPETTEIYQTSTNSEDTSAAPATTLKDDLADRTKNYPEETKQLFNLLFELINSGVDGAVAKNYDCKIKNPIIDAKIKTANDPGLKACLLIVEANNPCLPNADAKIAALRTGVDALKAAPRDDPVVQFCAKAALEGIPGYAKCKKAVRDIVGDLEAILGK